MPEIICALADFPTKFFAAFPLKVWRICHLSILDSAFSLNIKCVQYRAGILIFKNHLPLASYLASVLSVDPEVKYTRAEGNQSRGDHLHNEMN